MKLAQNRLYTRCLCENCSKNGVGVMCENFMFFYGLIVGVLLCIGITAIILLLKIIHQLGRKIDELDEPL